MCLITPNKEVKKAEEDIECYKVLTKKLLSPFRWYVYKMNELYTAEIKDSDFWTVCGADDSDWLAENYPGISVPKDKPDSLRCISEGIHSVKTLDGAQRIKKSFLDETSFCVFKCVIPKGSEYLDSPFGYLVSNQLIIKEVINGSTGEEGSSEELLEERSKED